MYNTYSSIVPSEMSNRELTHMCTELQIAINWGLSHATVHLANGLDYQVEVERLPDYREARSIITN